MGVYTYGIWSRYKQAFLRLGSTNKASNYGEQALYWGVKRKRQIVSKIANRNQPYVEKKGLSQRVKD